MKTWQTYFEHNRDHRLEIGWNNGIVVDSELHQPLIRSLQRFQLGESGEGFHLRRKAKITGDSSYEAAIDLFIKEENEHARLMALVLQKLGAPLLRHHWSDGCFVCLRRLFGLNSEILVLLMPEMIAKRYFRALHDGFSDPTLRAVCSQILHDEQGHVAFHAHFLHEAFRTMPVLFRAAVRALWRLVYRIACLVVLLDHGTILRGTGLSLTAFWWDCGLIFDEVAAGIFSVAPAPAFQILAPTLNAEPA
jgi:hypothetical protein